MLKRILIGASLLLISNIIVASTTTPAQGPVCNTTSTFFEVLKKDYQEEPIIVGSYKERVVSVWINRKTKTATVVLTDLNADKSCLVVDMVDIKVLDDSLKI